MAGLTRQLSRFVRGHRCYTHPVFMNWAIVDPAPEVVGALFHQIQKFCASTRPGWNFPEGLRRIGLHEQGRLIEEIVASESGHGPELATMAGHIINRAARRKVCLDLQDQEAVESELKNFSDQLLRQLPGYDRATGLTAQARRVIAVVERRKEVDADSTYQNLGAVLALEMISNRQFIPGEKHCLVDSGLYGATLEEPEMHYLLEHWGEVGAEEKHEKSAMAAVSAVEVRGVASLLMGGAKDLLESLTNLLDVLDAALLQSGHTQRAA
jgi:hypothetical protein